MKRSSRPELFGSNKPALPNNVALYLIRDLVRKRKGLLHGKLRENDKACAIGSFFAQDHKHSLHNDLIDEITTYNDSMPEVTMKERRRAVLKWLNWKLKVLSQGKSCKSK